MNTNNPEIFDEWALYHKILEKDHCRIGINPVSISKKIISIIDEYKVKLD